MHGVMDKKATVQQSLSFAVALEKNNVPHKTIIELTLVMVIRFLIAKHMLIR